MPSISVSVPNSILLLEKKYCLGHFYEHEAHNPSEAFIINLNEIIDQIFQSSDFNDLIDLNFEVARVCAFHTLFETHFDALPISIKIEWSRYYPESLSNYYLETKDIWVGKYKNCLGKLFNKGPYTLDFRVPKLRRLYKKHFVFHMLITNSYGTDFDEFHRDMFSTLTDLTL